MSAWGTERKYKLIDLRLSYRTAVAMRRFSFPSEPPSEEGSPGEVRSRCPTPSAFWPASLATGPAGLSQRGVSAGFRMANYLAMRRANGRASGEPSARRAGEAGHVSLGTFLSCNKKVPRPPGRVPANLHCFWIPAFAGMTGVGAGDTVR
jgi:hypothetical protein